MLLVENLDEEMDEIIEQVCCGRDAGEGRGGGGGNLKENMIARSYDCQVRTEKCKGMDVE